jgi:hypothetical protein
VTNLPHCSSNVAIRHNDATRRCDGDVTLRRDFALSRHNRQRWIRHFHLVVEMDQVATVQHHFRSCTLLPSCTTFLRLLRPILRFAAKMFHLALESSQLLVVHWHGLEFSVLVKNWLCIVQRVHKLVLHPCGVARLPFVLVSLLSRNGIFKKPPHAAPKHLFSNDLLQRQIIPV